MVTVLLVVIIAMNLYFKRALQGRWKETSDQIGKQFTTNQFYTVETRQQSAREQVQGTAGEVAGENWVRSSVLNAGQFAATGLGSPADLGGIETKYRGHETTLTDYVKQSVGTKTLGTHGVMDSGKLSNIRLFDDD